MSSNPEQARGKELTTEEKWAEIKAKHRYAMSVSTAAGVRDEERRVQDWDGAKWFWISDAKPTKDEAIDSAWQRLQGAEAKAETQELKCGRCGSSLHWQRGLLLDDSSFRPDICPQSGERPHVIASAPIASVGGDETDEATLIRAQISRQNNVMRGMPPGRHLAKEQSVLQRLEKRLTECLESAPTAAEPVLGESEDNDVCAGCGEEYSRANGHAERDGKIYCCDRCAGTDTDSQLRASQTMQAKYAAMMKRMEQALENIADEYSYHDNAHCSFGVNKKSMSEARATLAAYREMGLGK